MLRDFFYSITTLFIWVSITCEVQGVDALRNEGRCSNESRVESEKVLIPLEMGVDAARNTRYSYYGVYLVKL